MYFRDTYPQMSDAHRKFIFQCVLASYEYLLENGEDELLDEIISLDVDVKRYPHILEKVREYAKRKKVPYEQ